MRIRTRRFFAPVLAAMVMLASGAACSAQPPSAGTGKDEGPPRRGGELVLAMSVEPRSLDPVVMVNNWGIHSTLGNALYGSLIGEVSETDGSAGKGLTESLKSDDKGLHWTLTLKDGLTFSDGSPLDAEAVAFNWKRHQDPRSASQSKAAAAMIKSAEADGRTLSITLKRHAPQFPQTVVNSALNWIAAPAALRKGAGFNTTPVAAGPFVVKSWARADKIVMARNPHYHDKGKPYLDGLTVRFNQDEPGRLTMLQAGAADITSFNSPAYAAKAEESGMRVARQRLNGGNMLWFNARSAPFNDPRARQAVAKAVDPKALNAAAYLGKAEVPSTLFAKSSPFFAAGLPVTGYDRAGAQRLFDQLAAEGKPVSFTISTFSSSETKKVVETVQSQLGTYRNVQAKVEVMDSTAALGKLADRSYQAIPGGFAFADPEPLLYENLHSESATDRVGFKDGRLDAALLKGREATTVAERRAAYSEVAKLLAELNPGILYVRTPFPLAAGPKVGGLRDYKQADVVAAEIWRIG
ncbi:ABC transporter substrate-binding protein [Actinomadura sp. SCN-SB]|uniref:ABC transporter substrate-binding protein n=1 Tax=Actinomadura sp. SCN-SB TaxID=3373092 RepID=UPI003753909D